MVPRSSKRVVTGVLAIGYGVVLLAFWLLVLAESEGKLVEGSWTASDVFAFLLFASVPVMLVAVGCLLCSSRADARLRLGATAITAVLLIAKVLLASHWAFAALQHQDVSVVGSLFRGLYFGALMVFVIAPSGAWALVLAGDAALLAGGPSDVLGGGAGNENGSGPAQQPGPRQLARLWGVLGFCLAVQLGGIALLWITGQPSDVTPVTATELQTAYRGNPAKADAKYRGKWLEVTGKVAHNRIVSTIAPWSGTVWLTLEPGEVTISVRESIFDDRSPGATYHDFASLAEGQEVTIRGYARKTESGVSIESPIIVK